MRAQGAQGGGRVGAGASAWWWGQLGRWQKVREETRHGKQGGQGCCQLRYWTQGATLAQGAPAFATWHLRLEPMRGTVPVPAYPDSLIGTSKDPWVAKPPNCKAHMRGMIECWAVCFAASGFGLSAVPRGGRGCRRRWVGDWGALRAACT